MLLAQFDAADLFSNTTLLRTTSHLDWVGPLSFFVIALVYFLVPAVGYRFERLAAILAALYLLVLCTALTLVQQVVIFFTALGPGPRGSTIIYLVAVFSILKLLLYFVALLSFTMGLQSLRVRRPDNESPPRDFYADH